MEIVEREESRSGICRQTMAFDGTWKRLSLTAGQART